MAKFSGTKVRTAMGLASAKTIGRSHTHEGDLGYRKDPKTALYTLAVTNVVGEQTFYEPGTSRDRRFVDLVHAVTASDPAWVASFVPFLRDTAQMRSASIVVAAEYAAAGGPGARSVIASACQRADEPAEVLGYWLSEHGRRIPMAVKRGIADAAVRLYNERSALKYDGESRAVRMGDVIELTHPSPKAEWQSALFRHLLDRRHGNFSASTDQVDAALLPVLEAAYSLEAVPAEGRRIVLQHDGDRLARAGFAWERLSGWLPGGMDAEAWESAIPQMGFMALLRNLRNFEQAGVRADVLEGVARKLSDPAEVAASRQFPYRFWSAYKHSGTAGFAPALESALRHSLGNVPELPGRSLILIDTSGSMTAQVSGRSQVQLFEIGAVFACAAAQAARRRGHVELVLYADGSARQKVHTSVLRTVQDVGARIGEVGYGTNTWANAQRWFGGHDRILVFTDMQDWPGNHPIGEALPVPIYVWDLAGYRTANIESGRGRYLFAGFSDAAFRLIPLLESGRDAAWPWE